MIYSGDLPKACHCLKQAVRLIRGHVLAQSMDYEIKATIDCLSNLTSEMHIASLSGMASGSSLHYFAHIVKVKFVLIHLLTVLTKHACQHNSFWGSRCVSSHAPTTSLKPVLFTVISALILRHCHQSSQSTLHHQLVTSQNDELLSLFRTHFLPNKLFSPIILNTLSG